MTIKEAFARLAEVYPDRSVAIHIECGRYKGLPVTGKFWVYVSSADGDLSFSRKGTELSKLVDMAIAYFAPQQAASIDTISAAVGE